MAAELAVTAISDEELEEGEIASSDEEEDKKKEESSEKPQETANERETNEEGENRKRPHSSCSNSTNEKRAKLDHSGGESDLEEGEIFSDDEEAAYYPQLVKSRNTNNQDKSRKDHSPSPSISRSRSPPSPKPSDEEQRTYHAEKDRSSQRDKRDSLEVHRSHGRYSQGRSPHRSPRSSRRDVASRDRDRDRFSSGRGRNSNTQDLIGQPIRHERGNRKWEEQGQPPTVRGGQILTMQMLENRLKQGLSLLLTPRTNPIYSLDELNYPAAPQWYMKAVSAYNRKFGQRRGGRELPSSTSNEDRRESMRSVERRVHTDGKCGDTVRPAAALMEKENKPDELVSGEEREGGGESERGHESNKMDTGARTEDHQEASDKMEPTKDLPLPLPAVIPLPASLPLPTVTSSGEPSKGLTEEVANSGGLRVSISLSQVTLTLTSHPTQPVTPTDNEEFNYDDYLDQLNNEEEEDVGDVEISEKSKHAMTRDESLPLFQGGFWIDTSSSSDSHPVKQGLVTNQGLLGSKDPLEEDFPSIKGEKESNKSHEQINDSLRALVSQDSIDDTIASEEGKDLRQLSKKATKSARRKQKDRQWLAKQRDLELEKKQQQQMADSFSKPKQLCKYFQNGFCVHGDKCQYSHDIVRERKREVCKFYLQDGCSKGDSCLFYHGEFPCKFHHTGAVCYHGDKCKFSHAPLTKESYDMLMTVVDPNLRDKVPRPGQPDVHAGQLNQNPLTQLPLQQDFQQPQAGGVGGGYPTNMPPPPPMPLPPQVWPNPQIQPPVNPEQPGFGPPPPLAPPPHPPMVPHPPPPPQPWANAASTVPFPNQPPQTRSDGMGLWQDPQHQQQQAQKSQSSTPPQPRSHTGPGTGPQLNCNVPLSPNFEIKKLFPDPHPQILPHDLATKLRKTLLPTPSSTTVNQPSFELEYWESTEQPSTPPPHPPPPPSPTQKPYLPEPSYPMPPPQNPSFALSQPPGDPFKQPPHRGMMAPGPMGHQAQQMNLPPPALSRHDPRFTRQRPPLPQQQMFQPPPPLQPPQHLIQPVHPPPDQFSPPHVGPGGFNMPPQIPVPPNPDGRGEALIWGGRGGGERGGMLGEGSGRIQSPPQHHPVEQPGTGDSKRSIDPRLKYSHLKIKSRSQGSSSSAATNPSPAYSAPTSKASSPQDPAKPAFKVPGLLQDRSKLSRPLAPHELFGSSGGKGEDEESGISLFGSSPKYYRTSNTSILSSSPMVDQQGFGEIKMDGSTLRGTEKAAREEKVVSGDNHSGAEAHEEEEKETDFVPSYLTHLDLGLPKDADTSGLKIDSAFGDLKERQRRLSEIGSSLSEDSKDETSSSPKGDAGSPKLTTMFSFGSSLY